MKIKILILILLPLVGFTQTKPVRIGIVGMTHDHVAFMWLNNPQREGIEFVGFAEPNRELAIRRISKTNLPQSIIYGSIEELIEKGKPDAICDFRSTYEHLETVQKCAPRGIHVMVEKPLAVSLDHAKQMEALAKKHNIHLLTNYETTWYASHQRAYEIINQENKIGEIRKVVVMDGHFGPKKLGVSADFFNWLTDPVKNGGGVLMDFGCYGADLMTWLMKGQKPISVTAHTQTFQPENHPKVEDEATIIVQYPKAQGIFQASWNWPMNRKDTEIYGEKGYIFANKELEMKVLNGGGTFNAKEESIKLDALPTPINDPFNYFAAVASGKINPENSLSSLSVNMVAMEILEAAKKSAKEKKTIFLK